MIIINVNLSEHTFFMKNILPKLFKVEELLIIFQIEKYPINLCTGRTLLLLYILPGRLTKDKLDLNPNL